MTNPDRYALQPRTRTGHFTIEARPGETMKDAACRLLATVAGMPPDPPRLQMPDGSVITTRDITDGHITYHARGIPGGVEVSALGIRSICVGVDGAQVWDACWHTARALRLDIIRRWEAAHGPLQESESCD